MHTFVYLIRFEMMFILSRGQIQVQVPIPHQQCSRLRGRQLCRSTVQACVPATGCSSTLLHRVAFKGLFLSLYLQCAYIAGSLFFGNCDEFFIYFMFIRIGCLEFFSSSNIILYICRMRFFGTCIQARIKSEPSIRTLRSEGNIVQNEIHDIYEVRAPSILQGILIQCTSRVVSVQLLCQKYMSSSYSMR